MRFRHLELFVRDLAAARDFYVRVLGFELEEEQGPEGGPPQFIWVRLDGLEVLLRLGAIPAPAPTYQRASLGIVLHVPDVGAAAAKLRGRGLEFRGDDGPGCLTFTDLDGHWFQLVDQA